MKNKLSSLLARLLFGQGDFNFLIYSGLIFERENRPGRPDNAIQNPQTSEENLQAEIDHLVKSC